MTDTLDIEEFEKYLAIDPHSLDEELVEQPDLFYRISQSLTVAHDKQDQSSDNLKQVAAAVELDIRDEAEEAGEKITEAKVKSMVLVDDDYIAALEAFQNARTKVRELTNLKDAFSQRSYMLRELVSLYTSNYWADAASSSAGKAYEE